MSYKTPVKFIIQQYLNQTEEKNRIQEKLRIFLIRIIAEVAIISDIVIIYH
jgi:hypothetical protein